MKLVNVGERIECQSCGRLLYPGNYYYVVNGRKLCSKCKGRIEQKDTSVNRYSGLGL